MVKPRGGACAPPARSEIRRKESALKAKRQAIAILLALTLSAANAFALADPAPPQTAGTEVSCEVEASYLFSLPLPASVVYPNTYKLLGDFTVEDLVLPPNAWLTVELIAGPMQKVGNPAVTLAYTLNTDIPAAITIADIGAGYDVEVLIDSAAFEAALPGQYRAALTFRVYLQPDGIAIWEGATVVIAEKAAETTPAPTPSPTRTPRPSYSPSESAALSASPSPGATLKPPITGDDTMFAKYGGILTALLFALLVGFALLAARRNGATPGSVADWRVKHRRVADGDKQDE